MRIALPFSYPLVLRKTHRHRRVEILARQTSPFDLRNLAEVADFHETYGVAERRFIADGIVYRALTNGVAEIKADAYSQLMSIDGPAMVSIAGMRVSDVWWTDAYGRSPAGELECPLVHPTLPAWLAANGWKERGLIDHDGSHESWIKAWISVRENIGLVDGNVFVATSEPVWTVVQYPPSGRVSLVFSERPIDHAAHACFAIGRRSLAIAYAASFPGFDGIAPDAFEWMPVKRRHDAVAMALALLAALPDLRRATAMLGDTEIDGESCYRVLTHLQLKKLELDPVLAHAAIGAVWALYESHGPRLAEHLAPHDFEFTQGIHRRVGFERDLDLEALQGIW